MLSGSVRADPTPQRIVSLNVCADQILVDLVPHAQIAAVSHLATDPLSSAKPERAAGLATTKGAAEDVLARDPDLILVGAYTTSATVTLLRRLGRRVVVLPQPDSLAGVRALIETMAVAVNDSAAGQALVAAMDQRIEAALKTAPAATDGRKPTALVYQPNNYVSAVHSLIGEALTLAGYDHAADRLPRAHNGQVALESLLLAPPDVLVLATGPSTYRTVVADNLRHPALAAVTRDRRSVVVPWPLWLCGTHHIAEVVERLAAARRP